MLIFNTFVCEMHNRTNQNPLFALSIDQAITQDNEVRLIDMFVDRLKQITVMSPPWYGNSSRDLQITKVLYDVINVDTCGILSETNPHCCKPRMHQAISVTKTIDPLVNNQ